MMQGVIYSPIHFGSLYVRHIDLLICLWLACRWLWLEYHLIIWIRHLGGIKFLWRLIFTVILWLIKLFLCHMDRFLSSFWHLDLCLCITLVINCDLDTCFCLLSYRGALHTVTSHLLWLVLTDFFMWDSGFYLTQASSTMYFIHSLSSCIGASNTVTSLSLTSIFSWLLFTCFNYGTLNFLGLFCYALLFCTGLSSIYLSISSCTGASNTVTLCRLLNYHLVDSF